MKKIEKLSQEKDTLRQEKMQEIAKLKQEIVSLKQQNNQTKSTLDSLEMAQQRSEQESKSLDKMNRMINASTTGETGMVWTQCNKCLKWRRIPRSTCDEQTHDIWECKMHGNLQRNSCAAPEER